MKITKTIRIISALASFSLLSISSAEEAHDEHGEKHEHGEKTVQTPQNGRLLEGIEPHAEFLITEENKVQITFFTPEGKTLPPTTQSFTLIAGDRAAPTKLTFTLQGDVFLSDQTLPEGKNYPAILTYKPDEAAQPQRLKFQIDLSECPTCDHLEYACTCDH